MQCISYAMPSRRAARVCGCGRTRRLARYRHQVSIYLVFTTRWSWPGTSERLWCQRLICPFLNIARKKSAYHCTRKGVHGTLYFKSGSSRAYYRTQCYMAESCGSVAPCLAYAWLAGPMKLRGEPKGACSSVNNDYAANGMTRIFIFVRGLYEKGK